MKSILINYHNNLEELKKFINIQQYERNIISKIEKKIIKVHNIEDLQIFYQLYNDFSGKRIFEYTAIIIYMYSSLESFIEESVKLYLNELSLTIEKFNELPEKIVNNHAHLSAILIQNLNHQKYNGSVSLQHIIKNMNDCINNTVGYQINVDAYTHHTANFKEGIIDEFFSKIGIENISSLIKKTPIFENYIKENEIDSRKPFTFINDLAERRNQVAHSNIEVQLLSSEILLDYINFLKVYSESLNNVLTIQLLNHRIKVGKNIQKLNNCIKTYGKNIICFEISNTSIGIGYSIYAETNNPNEAIKFGKINSMQINNTSIDYINSSNSKNLISLQVDFKVSKNYTYYLSKLP